MAGAGRKRTDCFRATTNESGRSRRHRGGNRIDCRGSLNNALTKMEGSVESRGVVIRDRYLTGSAKPQALARRRRDGRDVTGAVPVAPRQRYARMSSRLPASRRRRPFLSGLRCRPVGGGLELLQQHQLGVAAVAPRDAPDHVALVPFSRFGIQRSVLARHTLQVQVAQPRPSDELMEQLGYPSGGGRTGGDTGQRGRAYPPALSRRLTVVGATFQSAKGRPICRNRVSDRERPPAAL
jgi:hypothetical protein